MNTIEDTIKQYLVDQLLVDFDADVTSDSNLFKLGLIDSFGYIELVGFLESEFDIKFTNDELSSSGLVSLSAIGVSVAEKTNAQQLQC